MKKIVIFDTASGTLNMGDYIIQKCFNKQMKDILERNFVVKYSTHTPIQKLLQNFRQNDIKNYCNYANFKFICGTNIFKYDLFKICPDFNLNCLDTKIYKNSISVGCGSTPNARKINFYTRFIYKRILSKEYVHSTRDEKTKIMLENLGVKAINTGCVTMWGLTPELCKSIPQKKAKNVVFTLTDYAKNKKIDQLLINTLIKNYTKIYFWIQGSGDLEYLKTFENISNIILIGPALEDYDKLLEESDVDFVGTRLHAGINAMLARKRTIIIAVDNRARDIKETYNIPTIEREELEENLDKIINSDFSTNIKINIDAINKWKSQFLTK